MKQQIPDLVRSYYRYVDAGDAKMFDLFDANIRYKRPGYALIEGMADFRRFYTQARVIADGSHLITGLYVDGLAVAVEGVFTGTLKDQSHVRVPFSDFFKLSHGPDGPPVIVERRTYFDDHHV